MSNEKRSQKKKNVLFTRYAFTTHQMFIFLSCLQSSIIIFIQTLFQRNFCFRRNLALFAVSCKLSESELYKVLREQMCPGQRGLTVVSFWYFDWESKNLEYKMNSAEYLLDSFIPWKYLTIRYNKYMKKDLILNPLRQNSCFIRNRKQIKVLK